MIDQYIYTIRRKSDGALVAQGTAEQCAKDLGICLATFYRRRWRKIGGYDAYEVIAPTRRAPHLKRKQLRVYSIFRAGTNDVIVTGTAQQCADALGMNLMSFRSMITRISSGTYCKYDYQREGYIHVE